MNDSQDYFKHSGSLKGSIHQRYKQLTDEKLVTNQTVLVVQSDLKKKKAIKTQIVKKNLEKKGEEGFQLPFKAEERGKNIEVVTPEGGTSTSTLA